MMHATLVHVEVRPGFEKAFIAATQENCRGAIEEPGNLRFDLLQDPERPSRFVLYEVYRDERAALAHQQTPHHLTWQETVEPWMEKPPRGEPLHGLFPG